MGAETFHQMFRRQAVTAKSMSIDRPISFALRRPTLPADGKGRRPDAGLPSAACEVAGCSHWWVAEHKKGEWPINMDVAVNLGLSIQWVTNGRLPIMVWP